MSTNITDPSHFLWTEKYRPDFENVIIPPEIKVTLQTYMGTKRIPSFLFYSQSPGTGKTTTAKAMAKYMGSSSLFINASVENGIDVIRTMVTQYATTSGIFDEGMKIVILDEADRLSPAAQDGLKGLMEAVSKNCAFILTCNNKGKITDPLRSRVTEIDFIYTPDQQHQLSTHMLKRMISILKEENVEVDLRALADLVKRYVPDNRKLIEMCQFYAQLNGKIDTGILAVAESRDIKTLIGGLKDKKYEVVLKWGLDNGDSIRDDFYRDVYNNLKNSIDMQQLARLILILNEYQRYHSTVPDRLLHLVAMCTQIMMEITFK